MDHPNDAPETTTPPADLPPASTLPPPIQPRTPQVQGVPYATNPMPQKTPVLAAILSFVPGLGNIYNGLYLRGFAFFLIQVVLFALTVNSGSEPDIAFLVPTLVFFWFFNVFDAYRQANFINYGYGADVPKEGSGEPSLPTGLMPGVALLGLGLYGVLREYFDFDFSWVLHNWPIFLILIGAGLVAQSVVSYRKRQAVEVTAE